MKSPCPQCAASSVWVGLDDVRRERGSIVMTWVCRSCQHRWKTTSERIAPVKASTASVRPVRRRRRS